MLLFLIDYLAASWARPVQALMYLYSMVCVYFMNLCINIRVGKKNEYFYFFVTWYSEKLVLGYL